MKRPLGPRLTLDRSAVGGLLAAGAIVVLAIASVLGAFSPPGAAGAAGGGPGAGSGAGSGAGPAGGARDGSAAAVVAPANAGQTLFLQSCAACHGPTGAGTDSGPSIQSAGPALVDFVLRTGRMPLAAPDTPMRRGVPVFDDQQIHDLVAYVTSQGASEPAIPTVVTDGADLQNGLRLYTANCAACHGTNGQGGAVGGGFVAPALDRAEPLDVGEAALGGPNPMPRFDLDASDLNDLAAYVEYLREAPRPGGVLSPSTGPVAEGFVAALALIGVLLVARFVGVRRSHE